MADEDKNLGINEDKDRSFAEIQKTARDMDMARQERAVDAETWVKETFDSGMTTGDVKSRGAVVRESNARFIDSLIAVAQKYVGKYDSPEYREVMDHIGNIKENLERLKTAQSKSELYHRDGANVDTQWRGMRTEVNEMKSLRAEIQELSRGMDDLLLVYPYDESDPKRDEKFKEFKEFFYDMTDLCTNVVTFSSGNLYVPPEGELVEGKKTHFINASGRPELDKETYKDFWADATYKNSTKEQIDKLVFRDRSSEPLFSHEPSQDDIEQGNLGDCYMLSALSSICAQDPELIREAMVENPDGKTVTVRFYNYSMEPVFVTVDKVVPVIYAQGPLWVQLMEKAYVHSGLHINEAATAEEGRLRAHYIDIDSIFINRFAARLLGKGSEETCGKVKHYSTSHDSSLNQNTPYTAAEKKEIEEIYNDWRAGRVMAAGIHGKALPSTVRSYRSLNLVMGHAYAVTSFEKASDGKFYVTVRNPHAKGGAEQNETGTVVHNDPADAKGYSKLEYREFKKYFDIFHSYDINTTPFSRAYREQVQIMRNNYGKVVDVLDKLLNKDNGWFMKTFGNVKEFNALHAASNKVAQAFRDSKATPEKLKNALADFFDEGRKYKEYRDANTQWNENSSRNRNRYQAASFIVEFEKAFKANEAKPVSEEISIGDIFTKAFNVQPGEYMSEARRIMTGMQNTGEHDVKEHVRGKQPEMHI